MFYPKPPVIHPATNLPGFIYASSSEWCSKLEKEDVLKSVEVTRTAMRLQRDFDINPAGSALALDLPDKIETLKARL